MAKATKPSRDRALQRADQVIRAAYGVPGLQQHCACGIRHIDDDLVLALALPQHAIDLVHQRDIGVQVGRARQVQPQQARRDRRRRGKVAITVAMAIAVTSRSLVSISVSTRSGGSF